MKSAALETILNKIKALPDNAAEPHLVKRVIDKEIVVDYGHLGKLTISYDWLFQEYPLDFAENGVKATVKFRDRSNMSELMVVSLFEQMRLTTSAKKNR